MAVQEGEFSNGMPFLTVGEGPPLVVMPGLTNEHIAPTGMQRRMILKWCEPFARHFTIHWIQRKPGLAPGATMSDIAADYAAVIEGDLDEPILLHGTSTGGSVALQLAIDRPELVRRMVIAAAACRLSPAGREMQAEMARLTRAGDHRGVAAMLLSSQAPSPLRYPAKGVGWALGGSFKVADPSDVLTVIAAEDAFDVEPDLGRTTAPALVLGGSTDTFYTPDLFERTAAGMPDGRAVVLPGKGHLHVAGSKSVATLGLGYLLGG